MKQKFFLLMCIFLCIVCSSSVSMIPIEYPPTTWQDQLAHFKNKPCLENGSDADNLHLVSFTYKGVIKSEKKKHKIINSMFSDRSFIARNFVPTIERDTVVTGDSYEILVKSSPDFEITTIREFVALTGGQELREQFKQQLYAFVQIGFEVVKLKYSYKGDTFYSLAIVSNAHGGIIFDTIGYLIFDDSIQKTIIL